MVYDRAARSKDQHQRLCTAHPHGKQSLPERNSFCFLSHLQVFLNNVTAAALPYEEMNMNKLTNGW
jgi:hypothetical protein